MLLTASAKRDARALPLAYRRLQRSPRAGAESRLWRTLFEKAFLSEKVNTHIFNLRGQAAFKRRFHGEEVPTYIAFKRPTPIEMIALLRLLKTL